MSISKKDTATYALAAGLFSLAVAIGYFSFVLTKINANMPTLLDQVQVTQKELEPVLEEITEIRILIPDIVNEVERVRQEIPAIVEEVSLIREQIPPIIDAVNGLLVQIPGITQDIDDIVAIIPPILDEVEAIRIDTIPPILDEVSALQNETIPSVLNEVAGVRLETIPPILDEINEILLTVTKALDEVVVLRAEIPGYFDRADQVVSGAQTAGQQATEGAVVGIFTGIIKAPLNFLSSVNNSVRVSERITEEDKDIAAAVAREVADLNELGVSRGWENPETGAYGRIRLIALTSETEKTLDATLRIKNGTLVNHFELYIIRGEDGAWIAYEVIELN